MTLVFPAIHPLEVAGWRADWTSALIAGRIKLMEKIRNESRPQAPAEAGVRADGSQRMRITSMEQLMGVMPRATKKQAT